MALKKLPFAIQSMFSASTQINTFKTAVEELVDMFADVYNAFDADSTSIAIRVHIQENFIQVVDNGHGVAKNDFNLLGQRHSTSKYEDQVTSNSNQKYGCSGQSLANIIEVSESVTITSRWKNRKEAWVKHFYKGKEQGCPVRTTRPSIGTTVEVKGFLYNMIIQKKTIKALQELQRIKTFLVQISLVHCSTSISLRDNTDNEIIFKIHKNRDIFQTLALLMGISKSKFQELQVEKNLYKVTGYIQKMGMESHGCQWIYLNNRFIDNSKLHKIVNQNLTKHVASKKRMKVKSHNNEEDKSVSNNKLPDYFIFITCPYTDYDIISNPKQSMLEFKNWNLISRLLEKLILFFTGSTNLVNKREIPFETVKLNKADEINTRNQVKQIMNKILGSNHRKNNGPHLHNGVKGKIVKRKIKNSVKDKSSKLNFKSENKNSTKGKNNILTDFIKKHDESFKDIHHNSNTISFKIPKKKPTKNKITTNTNKEEDNPSLRKTRLQKKYEYIKRDPVISKFEKEYVEVQNRCHILARKAKNLLDFKKKRKCKVFTNEIVQYSTVVTDNKGVSVRKKIDEVIIHEYLPLPSRKPNMVNRHVYSVNDIMKSYDLIHPVDNIVKKQTNDFIGRPMRPKPEVPPPVQELENITECDIQIPRLTYESHSYDKDLQIRQPMENPFKTNNRFQFMSKTSRENLASPKKLQQDIINANWKKSNKKFNLPEKNTKSYKTRNYDNMFTDISQSSYSIHFTRTKSQLDYDKSQNIMSNVSDESNRNELFYDAAHIGSTYTIIDTDGAPNNIHNTRFIRGIPDLKETNAITMPDANIPYRDLDNQSIDQRKINDNTMENNNLNVVFVSNSQHSNTGFEANGSLDPLRICETVLDEENSGEYNIIFNSINNVIELNASEKPPTEVYETISYSKRENNKGGYNNFQNDVHLMYNWTKPYCNDLELNNFDIKNRKRFIPKGFSQIFENCNTKNVCDYEFDKDYFEKTVYNNFAQDVQINAEIFEPTIQNVKELASRDIEKVNSKLSRQNTCLTFNGEAINEAHVLGQVDYKFIAAKIKHTKSGKPDYLVLFDQHAVHERIRLERNMAEYFNEDQWKSVSLDGISLQLNKDEILYLHNCKDKFSRLGLQWIILNESEVSITAIPEAIFGKNIRPVDIVLKSVKNLIKEVINMIKEQGGCVSLYPKSIMDLVFSEACRYAIMFGDALSKVECASLLNALSECKTPFQCAHGRPVMAVLMDIKDDKRTYKIEFTKIQQFQRKLQKTNKKH